MDKIELIKKEQKKLNAYRVKKIKKAFALIITSILSLWVAFAQIYFLAISCRLTWFLIVPALISDIALIYALGTIIKKFNKRYNV